MFLPALEHHTYSEEDVAEGGIKKIKEKLILFMKSPLLDVGGFAKQGIKNIRRKRTLK
jgi:hypothetical protein